MRAAQPVDVATGRPRDQLLSRPFEQSSDAVISCPECLFLTHCGRKPGRNPFSSMTPFRATIADRGVHGEDTSEQCPTSSAQRVNVIEPLRCHHYTAVS